MTVPKHWPTKPTEHGAVWNLTFFGCKKNATKTMEIEMIGDEYNRRKNSRKKKKKQEKEGKSSSEYA